MPNLDGEGNFGSIRIIDNLADGPRSIYAAKVNDDEYIDIVAGIYYDNEIVFYKNLGPTANTESQSISNFSIFPNPSKEIINIESQNPIKSIKIFNELTQQVISNFNQNTIDISNLSKGVYFIKIMDIHSNSEIEKIIKN